MSSRRKSFTPCMVSLSDVTMGGPMEMDLLADEVVEDKSPTLQPLLDKHHESVRKCEANNGDEGSLTEQAEEKMEENPPIPQKQQCKGYLCKYCSFSTQNLNEFKEHVYSTHPNVILNPLYLCAVCNFSTKKFDSLTEHNETEHPGEINFKFKRLKLDNQTILEQTIENEEDSNPSESTFMQDANDAFDFLPLCPSTMQNAENPVMNAGNDVEGNLENFLLKDPITAVNVNGTIIIPEPVMLEGFSHVMPLLQRPPNLNTIPTIAVPLNTSKYNPLLDTNTTLITSFNKFPYPTHAELSWLTAASKHPEEQIKVWFTTQRLKQGITWSPEEVEEARKKMFNGCMPPAHHTFTVLPIPVSEPVATSQSVAPAIPYLSTLSPLTATNTSAPCATVTVTAKCMQKLKRPLGIPAVAPEVKRPMIPIEDHKQKSLMAPPSVHPLERSPMAPPPAPLENKRSVLPPLIAADMKRQVAPYALPKGKVPMLYPLASPKDGKTSMAPPPLLPRDRPSMVPLVSTDLKRSSVSQLRNQAPPYSIISKDKLSPLPTDLNLPLVPPLVASQVKRPTIIQTARASPVAQASVPAFSLEFKPLELTVEQKPTGSESRPTESQNGNNCVPRGDGKNWFSDQSALAHNGLRHLNNDFAPKEHPKRVPTQFPLLERLKGKTAEQLNVLEESFQRNGFPSHNEVDQIAITSRLSREEIDSWFSERRALRDNLEKALLNSMGSRRNESTESRSHSQHQHAFLNGVYKQGGLPMNPLPPIIAPTSSLVPIDRKSLNLLKDVFVQTRWPSLEEYTRLEAQTGLARTDIVRWFKDSRLALRSGTVELKELFHKLSSSELNGRPILDQPCSVSLASQEQKMPTTEFAKLSSQEIKEWFSNSLGQHGPEVGRNGGHTERGGEECGGWVEEAAGGKMASRELLSDMD